MVGNSRCSPVKAGRMVLDPAPESSGKIKGSVSTGRAAATNGGAAAAGREPGEGSAETATGVSAAYEAPTASRAEIQVVLPE